MREPKTIYISKKKFFISFFVLFIFLFVGGWMMLNMMAGGLGLNSDSTLQNAPAIPGSRSGNGGAGYRPGDSSGSAFSESSSFRPSIPRPGRNNADITDTREFLKTDYSANIATRDVQRDVDKVEDAIKSVDGRVDSLSSNEKYGRISFVVPKSDLSEFRDEIEKIAHAKLYTENISSTNLLNQKQAIEERAEYVNQSLTELETTLEEEEASYLTENRRLQGELSRLQSDLSDVQVAIAGLQEDQSSDFLATRLTELKADIAAAQREITNNNRQYTAERNTLSTAIERAGGEVTAVAAEDTDFMNDIETVEGYVSVRWVSVYEYLGYFSPIPMWINTLFLILVVLWLLRKIGILPRVRFK